MIYPIYIMGSDVLRAKAKEIDPKEINKEEFAQFVDDLWKTMKESDGVGLACPQIGKSLRMFVVDGSDVSDVYPELKDFKRIMINPVIVEESEETSEYGEGCLSVPGINGDVIRPKKITIKYLDEKFEEHIEELDNFGARMVQHEYDHLNGILFVDHFSPIRKKMIASKLHNIQKGKVRTTYKIKLVRKK